MPPQPRDPSKEPKRNLCPYTPREKDSTRVISNERASPGPPTTVSYRSPPAPREPDQIPQS
ncbi:hypothetical protein B9Z19DRAFT_1081469 [Tuber borchii]|uniref:Uncharacterized protein n=1 Tax=Tuber borchii TaxID=42251 RepID=A0A2T6ZVK0_TUBBO|nr:hypothetical protein B9Z19DRAFT_1081469 [Tuber borchii]